ncbi:hypothetical protein ACET3Z_024590 [Daucus carota]
MDTCNKLYTFDMTVGSVEELMDWDQGMGLHHPNFMDVFVSHNAPDTVNFNISVSVAEQIEDLSLEMDEMEKLMDGTMEDSFMGSMGPKCSFLAHGPPIGNLD